MTDPRDKDELHHGPSLDANGRLEGRFAHVEAPPAAEEEKLELAERAPPKLEERVEKFREERGARSARPWALKLVISLLLLGVVGLAAFLTFKPRFELRSFEGVRDSSLLDGLTASPQPQPIIISSTPTGATILIGGKNVGQTPWAGENQWVGETQVVLKLAGYKTWSGTITGSQPLTLDISLKK